MTERNLLHGDYIETFARYCEGLGWMRTKPKGEYEVLRMTHPQGKEPLIVHRRLTANEHVTVWGVSLILAQSFLALPRHVRRELRAKAER